MKFVQKWLLISMRLCKSRKKVIKILGNTLGYFPVRYSRWLEKRLFEDNWDPMKRYRKANHGIKNRFKTVD